MAEVEAAVVDFAAAHFVMLVWCGGKFLTFSYVAKTLPMYREKKPNQTCLCGSIWFSLTFGQKIYLNYIYIYIYIFLFDLVLI